MSDVSQGPGWWQASDGKWYPPQQAPTAAPPPPQWGAPPAYRPPPGPVPQWTPPPAKKGGNKGCLIALAVAGVMVVLGIVAVVVVVNAVSDEVDERVDDNNGLTFSDNEENPPPDDVTIDECGPAAGTGYMRATVDVLNHSSEPSNYLIIVAFESEGGGEQFTTSTAGVDGLGPDQTTTVEANSFTEAPGGRDFTCKVSRVERFRA
jgi:hypothetical protein